MQAKEEALLRRYMKALVRNKGNHTGSPAYGIGFAGST